MEGGEGGVVDRGEVTTVINEGLDHETLGDWLVLGVWEGVVICLDQLNHVFCLFSKLFAVHVAQMALQSNHENVAPLFTSEVMAETEVVDLEQLGETRTDNCSWSGTVIDCMLLIEAIWSMKS